MPCNADGSKNEVEKSQKFTTCMLEFMFTQQNSYTELDHDVSR